MQNEIVQSVNKLRAARETKEAVPTSSRNVVEEQPTLVNTPPQSTERVPIVREVRSAQRPANELTPSVNTQPK